LVNQVFDTAGASPSTQCQSDDLQSGSMAIAGAQKTIGVRFDHCRSPRQRFPAIVCRRVQSQKFSRSIHSVVKQ
jgi:hypothetical protein